MDYRGLLEKYNVLLEQVERLKKENIMRIESHNIANELMKSIESL
jgi:hypothetical protein